MVETRLAHSANRSGTNNVEMSPTGDYRRGDRPSKQLYIPTYHIVIFYFVLFMNLSFLYTSSFSDHSDPFGRACGIPQLSLCCGQHRSNSHTPDASREDFYLQF